MINFALPEPKQGLLTTGQKARMKLLYMAEKSVSEIETITGVPARRVAACVTTNKWAEERRQLRQKQSLATEQELALLQERRRLWVKRNMATAESAGERAIGIIDAAIDSGDPKQFLSAIRALDTLDTFFRRNAGMQDDRGIASPSIGINLIFNAREFEPAQHRVEDVIEIDAVHNA